MNKEQLKFAGPKRPSGNRIKDILARVLNRLEYISIDLEPHLQGPLKIQRAAINQTIVLLDAVKKEFWEWINHQPPSNTIESQQYLVESAWNKWRDEGVALMLKWFGEENHEEKEEKREEAQPRNPTSSHQL